MVFVLFSQVTEKGAATLKERPERVKEVDREIEEFGVRVLHQYAVLGPYDFVTIVEAPDPASVARMSVELAARGTVKIQSFPAVSIDDFLAKFK
jgi:uncharacterized protein with GYD domain